MTCGGLWMGWLGVVIPVGVIEFRATTRDGLGRADGRLGVVGPGVPDAGVVELFRNSARF